MPLVTAVVLAYAAGLLVGFGVAPPWAGGALALVLAAAASKDRLALTALGVAGFAVAQDVRGDERRCADRLAGAPWLVATIVTEASPGAFVRGTGDCGAPLSAAIREGRARAGARVELRGTPTRTARGVLVQQATVREVRPPGPMARWRATVGRRIDTLFGARAPLVRALLIADMHDLTPAVRERFAAAGLSHMLSVSGLHVGLIATAILLLAQVFGVPRTRADLLTTGITVVYVAAIGAPLPAVRAAVMLGVMALSHAAQRPTSPWAVLAVGGGLPLLDPRSVTDVGYQLSIVGMVALVASASLAKRWAWLGSGGWQGTLKRSVVTSTVATVFTAPLVAAVFGQVSLVAPLTNLMASPVMTLLQPMLFLVALLLPADGLARFVADATLPLLLAVDRIAGAGAALPGASVPVLADALSLSLACACVAALAVACVSRRPGQALLPAAAAVAIIAWRPVLPAGTEWSEIHMLDVGQGDAIAVRTARGSWVLFDAGREWEGGDAGRRTAVPYLARRGGALHAFVLSHPHADHAGGAASTIALLRPSWYVDPGYAGASRSYRASLVAAQAAGTQWRRVRPGDSLVVDDVVISFLAPDSAWAESLDDPNDASTVAAVRVGDVRLLMTGDAEAGEEQWLLAHRASELRADILKVAHHGSATSSTPAFVARVAPRLALVSVGAGNRYGHPSPEVMRRLAAAGATVLRTDLHGTIVVRTDGRSAEVQAGGERWPLRLDRLPQSASTGQF